MKNYSKLRISEYMIPIIIILIIIASFYFQPLAILGLVVGTIYVLKKNTTCEYGLLLCLLPFAQVFKYSASSTSLFTVLEIVIIVKHFLITSKVSKRYFILVFGYPLLIFMTSMISGNIDLLKIIKMFVSLSLLYFFIDGYQKEDIQIYSTLYSVGLICASVVGLFKKSIPGLAAMYTDANTQYINGATVTRFSATFTDPNYYSLAVIVALGFLICVICCGINMKSNLFFCVVLTLFGLRTYSKSFILMLIILLIISLILLIVNGKVGWTTVLLIVGIFILSSGVLSRIEVVQALISRFSTITNVNDLTTGRNEIWSMYLDYILSNPRVICIGDGIGAAYIQKAMHNIYIEIWYYVGILGGLLYIITLGGILHHRTIVFRKNSVNYFLIVVVAFMYSFLCGFTAFEFSFYMMICWIVINTELIRNKRLEL